MTPVEKQEKKPKKSFWSSMKMTKDGLKRWRTHVGFVFMTILVGTIIFYVYVNIPSSSFHQNPEDEFENAKRNISSIYRESIHIRDLDVQVDSAGYVKHKKLNIMGDKMQWIVTGMDDYTGWMRETWEGTPLPKYVVKLTAGVMNGPYFAWYPDGKKEGEGRWDRGRRMYSRAWHQNGEPTPTKIDNGTGVVYIYDGSPINLLLGKVYYEGGTVERIEDN
jgi:hypothetical protein